MSMPADSAPSATAADAVHDVSPPQQGIRPAMHALPVQLTRFVGRERELERVARELERTRLLTLTGAGGSGKTRLALEVARTLGELQGEAVAWVELGPLGDPALLPREVAAALGVREQPDLSLTESIIYSLGTHPLLLVLDNCEHVVEACAALVDSLLRNCPQLRVLATSREALGIAGETAWLVPPLALPPANERPPLETLARSEAVQLFIERASAAQPRFALTEQNAPAIVHICRRLDGLPLPIELAAARVRVLTPEQIAQRLDDAFRLLTSGSRTAVPRHQTLRATIDWSYQLLGAQERLLLQRLSVFSGGWSLDAAEAICSSGGIERDEILDLLAALVDRSLVAMQESEGEARYRLLETVRQYAAEHLRAQGEEEAVHRRHAEYFLAFADAAEEAITRGQPQPSWDHQKAEHDNLRAALAWTSTRADSRQLHCRLASVMWWFWLFDVHWREGLRWLEGALALLVPEDPPALRARLAQGAGLLTWVLGDPEAAHRRLAEAEAFWRRIGDARRLSQTLGMVANVTLFRSDVATAVRAAEESVALARREGTAWDLALALTTGLGYVHHFRRDFPPADAAYAEAETLWRRLAHPWGLTLVLHSRAVVAWMRGDLEQAAILARASLQPIRQSGDRWFAARSLFVVAAVAFQRGDPLRAARLLGAARANREAVGALVLVFERPTHQRVEDSLRAALGDAAFAAAEAEGAALSFEQALSYALETTEEAPAPVPVAGAGSTAGEPERGAQVEPLWAPAGPTPPAPAAAPTPALRILALGPVEIYRDGELVAAGEWNSAKPRELLLYLLCHPKGSTKEQVGLALWPESSPAQVRNSFHVTLHRLRRALGRPEWIVVENDRYSVNRTLGYEFDVERFEEQLGRARRLLRERPAEPAAAAGPLAEALALYQGDFAQDEVVGDWCVQLQDELRRLYVEGLTTLAELRSDAGDYDSAAQAYRRVLLKEDLREEAHRELMRCYARLGQRSRALQQYQTLVEILRAELDAEPEPETTVLFDRLRRGEAV